MEPDEEPVSELPGLTSLQMGHKSYTVPITVRSVVLGQSSIQAWSKDKESLASAWSGPALEASGSWLHTPAQE